MAEYIKKQAAMTLNEAIEHAKEVAKTSCGDCAKEHGQLAGWLEELVAFKCVAPTPADVRPVVKGEWIDERWYDLSPGTPVPYLCFATCSACKQESIVNIKRGKAEWEIDSGICPHCGADMRGGDAE